MQEFDLWNFWCRGRHLRKKIKAPMVLWYCVKTTPAALLEWIYCQGRDFFQSGLNRPSNPASNRVPTHAHIGPTARPGPLECMVGDLAHQAWSAVPLRLSGIVWWFAPCFWVLMCLYLTICTTMGAGWVGGGLWYRGGSSSAPWHAHVTQQWVLVGGVV